PRFQHDAEPDPDHAQQRAKAVRACDLRVRNDLLTLRFQRVPVRLPHGYARRGLDDADPGWRSHCLRDRDAHVVRRLSAYPRCHLNEGGRIVIGTEAPAIGSLPPLGEVPRRMLAQVLRSNRLGDPRTAFQIEEIDTPEPG